MVERSWSDVVLANYKKLKWTTEGGDITELRNMLQIHTDSITLAMQALQSRSLARLEKTVVPMAGIPLSRSIPEITLTCSQRTSPASMTGFTATWGTR